MMESSVLIIRKFIFYHRKSKFRRTKNGKEGPAHDIGSLNSVMTTIDRENSDTRFNSQIRLLHLKTLLFDRGWIGVNNLPFIICGLIICFVPCCFCSPLPVRAGQEIPNFEMFRTQSDAVTNTTNTSIGDASEVSKRISSGDKFRISNWIVNSSEEVIVRPPGGIKDVPRRTKRKAMMIGDEVQNYLMTFGYIPPSDLETGNLRTEDQLRDAIRNLQDFAHIPVTGELDKETIELFKRPRCGLPDIPYHSSKRRKRYTLHGQKWHYSNITWSLRTFEPRNLDSGQVRSELHRALDVWAKHSKLTFREVNSDRADILVYFERGYHGDGYAFDGRGQILAHAFFPGGGRGGDAHFDEDEVWVLDPYADVQNGEGTSLFAVAAHEFGHSLGLSHSSVQGALMFPWYQGLPPNFELPEDDKHGIQQLYGRKEEKLWAKIPTYGPHTPHEPFEPPRTTPSPPTPPPRPRPRPRPTMTPPRRAPPRPPNRDPGSPDTCDTSYDAISVIRGEVFIFKDKYLWRIGDQGLLKDYPAKIDRLWYGLPPDFTHIDAVYERNDKKIVFFIGRMYYVFDANKLAPGYPKPIQNLGLPRNLDHLDAAMVWGHNSKTYFFSGTMYWRFDEDVGRVELDYPRDMSMWRGVGYNIDTVFQWKDGATYFFKGKGFWKFNDLRMRVETENQMASAPFWMGCPRTVETDVTEDPFIGPVGPRYSSASFVISNIYCLVLIAVAWTFAYMQTSLVTNYAS